MKRTVYIVALVIFALACVCSASAQTTRRGANAPVGSSVLAALPASDAVMTVDVQRLYKEALPRIYARPVVRRRCVTACRIALSKYCQTHRIGECYSNGRTAH